MLRLILFRHAKADRPLELPDHERPLALRGQTQARKMGEYIAEQQLNPDLVIISSAKRTQETWTLARDAGNISPPTVTEPRIYESSVSDLLDTIRQQDQDHQCIMLVGHNPGMERLTAWLVGNSTQKALTQLQQGFVVGGLAVIDLPATNWARLETGQGTLERFETPDTV